MNEKAKTISAVLFLAIFIFGAPAWAQFLYGDWRCAFAQCRIEVAP